MELVLVGLDTMRETATERLITVISILKVSVYMELHRIEISRIKLTADWNQFGKLSFIQI